MKTITFKIKLLNRVKPEGMEGYKRGWKPPVRLRQNATDDLNPFSKEVQIIDSHHAREAWGKEITSLQENTPWKIEKQPDFGDTLIGYVCIEEFTDFYREIYKPKQS
jgi:hypothetical protein